MIIKKFLGKNEVEATENAKKELGENLVIMNVRYVRAKGPFSFLKRKQVEVTAALEDEEEPLRQIRRIAEAQIQSQKRMEMEKAGFEAERTSAGNMNAGASSAGASSTAGSTAGGSTSMSEAATAAVAAAGERTGISAPNRAATLYANNAAAFDNRAIEKKLDTLQTLIETRLDHASEGSFEGNQKSGSAQCGNLQSGAGNHSGSESLGAKADSINTSENREGTADGEKSEDEQAKEMDRFIKLLYNTMIDNEMDEQYVNEIIRDAQENRKPGATMDFILSTIYQRMILKFGKSEGITPAKEGPKVVFFMGPTGVGKTTTIAKVASSFSVTEKKRVALLTTDTFRIAATDQLRTYASILEVPFRVIYSEEELAAAVNDFVACDYIFVDTAGHNHKDETLLEKQKAYHQILMDRFEYQSFLVLSATTRSRDLRAIVDNYREVAEYQLIFTKLDETDYLGDLFNIKQYAGTPIAYVTAGQKVPDDIEVFNAQKTVKQLLGGQQEEASGK